MNADQIEYREIEEKSFYEETRKPGKGIAISPTWVHGFLINPFRNVTQK